jgi:FemAB-related protein (PEP-CTERM system-associated)
MQIKLLTGEDPRWEAFVMRHPEATFFHRLGWKRVLEEAFGHPAYYFYAEQNGEVVGILPLGQIKSVLFGNALISTPFCVYGGALAVNGEIRVALEQKALELARELKVDWLEFRYLAPSGAARPTKDLYVTFKKSLLPELEANFKAIPRKQRAMVRKGMAAGLVSTLDDGIDRFYAVYAVSLRNLGTPIFPKRYFEVLKQAFGEACEILVVEQHGQPVAAVMSFYFKDEVLPYYGGGTPAARELAAFDFMYWEVMRRAIAKGVKVFDYGRSKRGTGSFRFKTHWGFQPQPLYYECELIRARRLPEVNPLNPKYRLFIQAWRRLPLPVANLIGPWLARSLG